MSETLVDVLDKNKSLAMEFIKGGDISYESIVKFLVSLKDEMDPERITIIDHGDYQGSIIFIVGETGYQPWQYWYLNWGYGSCSGCDSLESALNNGPNYDKNPEEVYKVMHDMASGFRKMNSGDEVA